MDHFIPIFLYGNWSKHFDLWNVVKRQFTPLSIKKSGLYFTKNPFIFSHLTFSHLISVICNNDAVKQRIYSPCSKIKVLKVMQITQIISLVAKIYLNSVFMLMLMSWYSHTASHHSIITMKEKNTKKLFENRWKHVIHNKEKKKKIQFDWHNYFSIILACL